MYFKAISTIVALLTLSGCKIVIESPDAGYVTTESNWMTCRSNSNCEIDVTDIYFDHTFIAVPNPGWEFIGWRKDNRFLCGGSIQPCKLTTSGLAGDEALTSILESNEQFYLEPKFRSTDGIAQYSPKQKAVHELRVTSGEVITTLDGKPLGRYYNDTIHRLLLLNFRDELLAYELIIESNNTLRAIPLFYDSTDCTGTFYSGAANLAGISRSGEVLIPDVDSRVSADPKSAFYKDQCVTGDDYHYLNGDPYYLYRKTDLVLTDTYITWRQI